MTELDTLTIEEASERLIDYRGKTPPKTSSGVRLITAKVIKGGQILEEPKEFIAADFYDEWMRRGLPKKLDVLITTEAPLGEVAILRDDEKVALAQRVILLRAREDIVNPTFMFYALQSDFGQGELKARASGTTVLGIKQSELRQVRIPVFPLPIQRRIAGILSAYDELIENNQRRIRILEEMARSLYCEWFVHFRYPGHESVPLVDSPLGQIPQGWEAIPFERLLASMTGGDWGSEQPADRDTAEVGIVRGTDFDEVAYGGQLRVPVRYITPSSFTTRGLRAGDVVIENSINAKSRCIGTTLLVDNYVLNRLGRDAVAASFCKVFRLHDPRLAPLVHLHVRHLREDARMEYYQNVAANGIGNFQAKKFAKEEQVVLPSNEVTRVKLIEPIAALFNSVGVLASQLSNLRRTRDMLLPRLLSGQVPLDAMEPELDEVMP